MLPLLNARRNGFRGVESVWRVRKSCGPTTGAVAPTGTVLNVSCHVLTRPARIPVSDRYRMTEAPVLAVQPWGQAAPRSPPYTPATLSSPSLGIQGKGRGAPEIVAGKLKTIFLQKSVDLHAVHFIKLLTAPLAVFGERNRHI